MIVEQEPRERSVQRPQRRGGGRERVAKSGIARGRIDPGSLAAIPSAESANICSIPVAYPAYLRERARELRTTKKLSLDEIAERLALPKTPVYYWIKDLPLGRARRSSAGQRKGNAAMQANYRRRREAAYREGLAEYDELMKRPTFRDFVVLYIAEGYKRSRNTASLCNSDPAIVSLAARWLSQLSERVPVIRVQHHADQDVEVLRSFWSTTLGVDPAAIRFFPETNSGQLKARVGAASTASWP